MLFGQLSRNLKNQFTEQEKSFIAKGAEKVEDGAEKVKEDLKK